MAYTSITYDEAVELYLSTVRGLIPDADTSPGSDYDIAARAFATLFVGNQSQGEHIAGQILPKTADRSSLDLHAGDRSVDPETAAGSTGHTMLTASSGTDTQLSGSKLTHADGTEYETTANVNIDQPSWPDSKTVVAGSSESRLFLSPGVSGIVADQIVEVSGEKRAVKAVLSGASAIDLYEPLTVAPAGGTSITSARGALAPIKSTGTGSSTNKPQGDSLTLSSPTGAIDAATRVQDLGGGGDEETTEELRSRIVAFDAVRPASANLAHYREWSRTTPGVRIADAIVYPSLIHYGSIKVVAIGVEGARLVSAAAAQEIENRLKELGPYFDNVDVQPINYDGTPTDVSVDITPERGYEADWGDGVTSSFTVYFIDAGESTHTHFGVTPEPKGVVDIGDRFVFPLQVAGQWRLYHATIDGIGRTYITTNRSFPVEPSVGITLFPGGPLIEPVVAAIEEVFGLLGPGDKDANGLRHIRHPSPAVDWDHSLQLARITTAVMGVRGVDNVTINAPASDQEPNLGGTLRLGQLTIRTEAI